MCGYCAEASIIFGIWGEHGLPRTSPDVDALYPNQYLFEPQYFEQVEDLIGRGLIITKTEQLWVLFYRALLQPLTQDELAALKECSVGLPKLAPLFDVKHGENLIATLMSFAERGQQPWLNDNNIRSAMVEAANALLENVINEFVDTRTFVTSADCPDLNTEIDDTEFQANFYLFLFCSEILMAFAPKNRNLVVLAKGTFKFMPFFIRKRR